MPPFLLTLPIAFGKISVRFTSLRQRFQNVLFSGIRSFSQ